jgi:L-asparaginase II
MGDHDGLLAASMHRHDRGRLLRRLRQSSWRTPVRFGSGSGFSGIVCCCRQERPRRSGIGSRPETEELYAASMHRHDRGRLLRRLRQSSWRTPVRFGSGGGHSGFVCCCGQERPRRSGIGSRPGTEELYAARVCRHDRGRLLRRLRKSGWRTTVQFSGSGSSGIAVSCSQHWPDGGQS